MGRKPKKGLREAILAAASEQLSSASMIHELIEKKYGAAPTSLTGVIKAAEGLRTAGFLRASQAMPEVYRGARTRTYYRTTTKGKVSLKNAIADATAGWDEAGTTATPSQNRALDEQDDGQTSKRHTQKR